MNAQDKASELMHMIVIRERAITMNRIAIERLTAELKQNEQDISELVAEIEHLGLNIEEVAPF